jgi:hypothetical protein
VKHGTNMQAALTEARRLGASIRVLPRMNCWLVTLPGQRPIRVRRTEKLAPRNLVKSINELAPADPARPPLKRAKRSESKSAKRPAASRPPAAIRRLVGKPPTRLFHTTSQVHHAVGEIVLVRLFTNGVPTPQTVVIVEADPDQHRVIGLTQKSHYSNGQPRLPVQNFSACGFTRPVFIFTPRRIFCSRSDVTAHVGWADADLMNQLSRIS